VRQCVGEAGELLALSPHRLHDARSEQEQTLGPGVFDHESLALASVTGANRRHGDLKLWACQLGDDAFHLTLMSTMRIA
jgi:hypothetical protein